MHGIAYINPTRRRRSTSSKRKPTRRRATARKSSGGKKTSAAVRAKISRAVKAANRRRKAGGSKSRKTTARRSTTRRRSTAKRKTGARAMTTRKVRAPAIIVATRNRRRRGARRGMRRSYKNPVGLNFRSVKQILQKQTFVIAGSAIGAEFFTAIVARGGFAMIPGMNLGQYLPGYATKIQYQQFWNAGIKAVGAALLMRFRYKNAALGFGISSAVDIIRGGINQINEWTGGIAPASEEAAAYLDPVGAASPPGYAADNQFAAYYGQADGIYGSSPAFQSDAWA